MLSEADAVVWRRMHAGKRRWAKAVTFEVPSQKGDAARMAEKLLEALGRDHAMMVWIEEIIMTVQRDLGWYLQKNGKGVILPKSGVLLEANDPEGTAVLGLAMGNWYDFSVLSASKKWAMRVDHDQYATVFGGAGLVAAVREAMRAAGIGEVEWEVEAP